MLEIKGVSLGDYFLLMCERCGVETHNEYLGWDPVMPKFRATCRKCNETFEWKMMNIQWSGLPRDAEPN